MKTLVIDTAFEQCQVGLWDDTAQGHASCVASRSVTGGGQHDRVLVPLVEEALAESGIALSDLGRILVTTGPGRFTGLRVGIAFARGLALVHNTPLLGVSTMDALIQDWNDYARHTVLQSKKHVLLVAVKRGETYALTMDNADNPQGKMERVMDDDFITHFGSDESVCFAGMMSQEVLDMVATQDNMSVVDAVRYPSLQAIFAVGNTKEFQENEPVRPHYSLD